VDVTTIRTFTMAAMLLDCTRETHPGSGLADVVAAGFERAGVRVLRVAHAAAACERLAIAMPQVIVVLGTLHAAERDALADRATAVGALVMYVDPEIDPETLDELVRRAAHATVARAAESLVDSTQGSGDSEHPGAPTQPPGIDVDVDIDSDW
jgi:hypothetical protein